MKPSFLRILRGHLGARPHCTPGPVWTWCDWNSEEGLLPCICTCTCEDQTHCKRLTSALTGEGTDVAAGPDPSSPASGAAGRPSTVPPRWTPVAGGSNHEGAS